MPKLLSRLKNNLGLSRVIAIYYALKDYRTPIGAKILTLATILYIVSPFDVIPDFIPFSGVIDDILIIPLGLWLTAQVIPREVLQGAQAKAATAKVTLRWALLAIIVLAFLVWLVILGLWVL